MLKQKRPSVIVFSGARGRQRADYHVMITSKAQELIMVTATLPMTCHTPAKQFQCQSHMEIKRRHQHHETGRWLLHAGQLLHKGPNQLTPLSHRLR